MGEKIPQNWLPSDDDRNYGRSLKFTDVQIDEMAESMRLWANTNGHVKLARKSNWSLTFKNWMRRDAKNPRVKRILRKQQYDDIRARLKDAIAQEGDGIGQPPVRALPQRDDH